jgi:hypothetical protein
MKYNICLIVRRELSGVIKVLNVTRKIPESSDEMTGKVN